MMTARWLSSLIGIPLMVAVCWWGPRPFSVAMSALALVAGAELVAAMRRAGRSPNLLLACSGLFGPALPLLLVPGVRLVDMPLRCALAICVCLLLSALIFEVRRADATGKLEVASNAAFGLLIGAYVALFGGISLLRVPTGRWDHGGLGGIDQGCALVLVLLAAVWASDTGAFYGGRALGSRKLAPLLSPAKTVEGAVAGAAAAVIVATIVGHVLLERALLGWWIGAVAAVVGTLGDLFESAVKRELGVKDLGAWIPGHGGVLDRFDSLLFAGPAVLVLLHVIER